MNRKILFLLYVFFVYFVCSCYSNSLPIENPIENNQYFWTLEDTALVRFAVLSDTHIADSTWNTAAEHRFARALNIFKEIDPNIDMVGIIGDIVGQGTISEYDKLMNILDNNKVSESTKIIMSMGNHEYFHNPVNAKAVFTSKTGQEPNTHEVIKGIHFIFISPDRPWNYRNYMSSLPWLEEKLQEAQRDYDKNNIPHYPIFVFAHHGLRTKVNGRGQMDNEDIFYNIMKLYPNIIFFSGHSHHPLNDPRFINFVDFTSIETASTSHIILNESDKGRIEDGLHFGQALVIDVNTDGSVVVRRVDVHNERYIGKALVIDPNDLQKFSYENQTAKANAPVFPTDATVMVDNISTFSASISFTQANAGSLEEIVYNYIMEIKDMVNDMVVKNYNMWSDFYFYPHKPSLSIELKELNYTTQYHVTVTAYEPFGKASEQSISAQFSTLRD